MNSIYVGLITFGCVSVGIVVGLFLHAVLPTEHLKEDSRNAVQLGLGLIGTMTAILLGILIGTAKGFFDSQTNELTRLSAKIMLLDRDLEIYGPDTKEARDLLDGAVRRMLIGMWPSEHTENSAAASLPGATEVVYKKILALTPQTELQHSSQRQALETIADISSTRWLMFEQKTNSVPSTLIIVVVFWLALTFCGFGLLAPRTPIVIGTFALCALCVSGAIFLLLDMYNPFGGLVQVSSAPLRTALSHLEQ